MHCSKKADERQKRLLRVAEQTQSVWRHLSLNVTCMNAPAGTALHNGAMTQIAKPANGRPSPQPRNAFRMFRDIPTRWSDNDVYGHVNNVVYYSWFDTAVNAYLIEQGALDIHDGETIGLVIETQCNYFSSLAFPQMVQAGVRVSKLGNSSVRYEIGLFAQGELLSAAIGHFVHVYVDKATRRPVAALPVELRAALEPLAITLP